MQNVTVSMKAKAAALGEILAFSSAAFLISRLRLWPIHAINGFFLSALGSHWNYGFLVYKIVLLLLVLLVCRRRLLPAVIGRGRNGPAVPFGLACAGLAMAPTGIGLLFGKAAFRPLDPAGITDIVLSNSSMMVSKR